MRREKGVLYITPFISGMGWEGIQLRRRVALPFTRRTDNLWKRCFVASSPSFPICPTLSIDQHPDLVHGKTD